MGEKCVRNTRLTINHPDSLSHPHGVHLAVSHGPGSPATIHLISLEPTDEEKSNSDEKSGRIRRSGLTRGLEISLHLVCLRIFSPEVLRWTNLKLPKSMTGHLFNHITSNEALCILRDFSKLWPREVWLLVQSVLDAPVYYPLTTLS